MTRDESERMRRLVKAAIRVARTPWTGVKMDCPMAMAVIALTVELAEGGFLIVDETGDLSEARGTHA